MAQSSSRGSPEELSCIEAHGTGTSLGTRSNLGRSRNCWTRKLRFFFVRARPAALQVGSVKTNLGHLEAAAGIAGLIKVVLALGQRQIPAHLHFKRLNTHISWRAAG